jgi:UDP-GlcNAc:undecaprenyl-phosphate/decaprenyl-phosphate GlcNAc-1-phosphate transferase
LDMSIQWYLSLFLLPFLITLIATPLISKLALKYNIVDQPGFHKTHSKAKPLLGGISIFISFAVILYLFLPLDGKLLSLAGATTILVITGLFDDLFDIKPLLKLCGQTVAAAIVVLWNADLFRFMIEYFSRFYLPGFVVLFLLIGWIVLMINAFNLIDGMDGLAAGTAAIIFLAMAVLSYVEGGRSNILAVQLIGAGACLGFLIFNFNPARIFMGDTGSMMLGFILATSHLYVIKYPFSAQLVLGSMFLFAYPALDVTYAFYRRICNHTPLLKADKGHIHHVLLSMGFSVQKVVITIYFGNICFAIVAVLLLVLNVSAPALLGVGIIALIFVVILYRFLYKISYVNGVVKRYDN